jgi:hypothetical protein
MYSKQFAAAHPIRSDDSHILAWADMRDRA